MSGHVRHVQLIVSINTAIANLGSSSKKFGACAPEYLNVSGFKSRD